MIKKIIINIAFIFFIFTGTFSQEVVSGLQINTIVSNAWENLDKRKGHMMADTLNLPFFDDFSQTGAFPDINKWTDKQVFINNTYSIQQITSGMATFDVLDETGNLYPAVSSSVFEADNLTSKPLDLNYPASDSIVLSFFYQPQGLADAPELNDSLTLEFFDPSGNKWYSVWRVRGTTVHDFKPVSIKIEQGRYLKNGFRFRFKNYGSLSSVLTDPAMAGNSDQWNIDYVLVDRNKSLRDTSPKDVAFTLPVRSLLKTHEAMPWKQFRQVFLSEMGSSVNINYRNNDNIVRNVTRNFEIYDIYKNTSVHTFTSGATNIEPYTEVNYNAGLFYTFNSDTPDSALFRVTSILKTDDFDRKENDTTVYYQRFGNYFAFDDGSSEGGYGINGLGSRNAMVAYRFRSFISDSLRAVQIAFNDSYLNSNIRSFDLIVWNDNNGIPGEVIYSQEDEIVTLGAAINGFYTYILNEPVGISGTFYVGWKQRSETFLNAGFDFNTQHGGRQLYWINGNWSISNASGSLMIRPVVGAPFKTTSISDVVQPGFRKLTLWPNPARDYLTVDVLDLPVTSDLTISIFDLQGRRIKQENFTERIDISSLKEGVYIIILYNKNMPLKINRFIKTF